MAPSDLSRAVHDAAGRPQVRAAVAELHAEVDRAIAQRRPLCVMSGKCCRFDEYGHRLYVTTIELAAFVHAYREIKPLKQIDSDGTGCPFQVGKLCGVHAIRPFGCRMFFCDPSSTEWQNERYEEYHAQLKRLHETMDVPYAYVEWRTALIQLGFK